MVEALMDKPAAWLKDEGPEADIVTSCECRLYRNLADFPFPGQCTLDEKRAVEERVVGVLENLNLFTTGQYWSLDDLDDCEQRFLVERHLVSPRLLEEEGRRGVYIADDQSLSITINGENHIAITALSSGVQLQELWSRINLIDDTLTGALDFAYNERLGYLTTAIGDLGTALKTSAVLHLPALKMVDNLAKTEILAKEKRHQIQEMYRHKSSADSDLYRLTNLSTLGRSEEEAIFHLKHLVMDIVDREREARELFRGQAPLQLEDTVGRALGLARGARLLAFGEALSVLSSLRLGVSDGLLDQFSLYLLNEVFMASQNAHIEMKRGHDCNELTLSTERADLFRARFA